MYSRSSQPCLTAGARLNLLWVRRLHCCSFSWPILKSSYLDYGKIGSLIPQAGGWKKKYPGRNDDVTNQTFFRSIKENFYHETSSFTPVSSNTIFHKFWTTTQGN